MNWYQLHQPEVAQGISTTIDPAISPPIFPPLSEEGRMTDETKLRKRATASCDRKLHYKSMPWNNSDKKGYS